MTRENVGIALNAMADSGICEQVAAGDLSGLGDLEFDEVEREAVIGAAEDYPEVTAFSLSFGSFNFAVAPAQTISYADLGRFGQALHYSYGDIAGPVLSAHEAL
jgi:hypothetical protein